MSLHNPLLASRATVPLPLSKFTLPCPVTIIPKVIALAVVRGKIRDAELSFSDKPAGTGRFIFFVSAAADPARSLAHGNETSIKCTLYLWLRDIRVYYLQLLQFTRYV